MSAGGLPGTCTTLPAKILLLWQQCWGSSEGPFLHGNANHASFFPSAKHWQYDVFVKCGRFPMCHPPVLDQAGLVSAIRDYVHGFTKRSGIEVGLEVSPKVGRMARDVELALFRVVQEVPTNIQRHSGHQHTKIRIDCDSSVTLEIIDNINAPSPSLPRHTARPPFQFGVGIQSMPERVNLIGGRLEIDSTNSGTIVRVTIPLGDLREKPANSAS